MITTHKLMAMPTKRYIVIYQGLMKQIEALLIDYLEASGLYNSTCKRELRRGDNHILYSVNSPQYPDLKNLKIDQKGMTWALYKGESWEPFKFES